MKARLETAHRSQIQWQKVEKQRAVRLRRQRNHLALLVLARVVVDPLQVRSFSAQTWTVVHQLAVNFARRKIDERHFVVNRIRPQTYSTRSAGRPVSRPRLSLARYTHTQFPRKRAELHALFFGMPPFGNA